MPDDDALVADESVEEEDTLESSESAELESPTTALEQRIAALESAQRQSVLEIRSAVGRVQSIAAKLDKTNDPATEAKLRTELAGVSELLGLVTDSIDESILPRDVKRKVSDAQATMRRELADAEINRRIAEATQSQMPISTGPDVNALEAAVVSQIQSLGLNDQDPAFNWAQAATILNTQGERAMWAYFGEVERQLLTGSVPEGGPQRRTRQAPRAASTAAPKSGVDKFLDKDVPLAEKLAEMRAQGILT